MLLANNTSRMLYKKCGSLMITQNNGITTRFPCCLTTHQTLYARTKGWGEGQFPKLNYHNYHVRPNSSGPYCKAICCAGTGFDTRRPAIVKNNIEFFPFTIING